MRAHGVPLSRNVELLAGTFGAAPLACVRSASLDCDLAWWRCNQPELQFSPLSQLTLGVRLRGATRPTATDAACPTAGRSQRGSLIFYPVATGIALVSDGGTVEELTLSFGPRCPYIDLLSRVCGGYTVARPDALIHALGLELADALQAASAGHCAAPALEPLLTLLLRRVQPRPARAAVATPDHAALHAVIADLPRRCGESLSTAELAAAAGLRPTRFTELFKGLTGFTPHQYLLRLRIEHCCHALRSSDARVADIALTLGFSSQSHLTTVFHKVLGVTPQCYRLACRRQHASGDRASDGF